jgi:rhamnose utilization protein RhaD (predicted bifunctional aldolase and dehydrogenase)
MKEFEALHHLSARIGADPLLVQAAGGNTSLKQDGVMWIKASGTWLKDSLVKNIFVPLDLPRLQTALTENDPNCESCLPFVVSDMNPDNLRPSIETSVHGLMPFNVVLHVHCVSTIAWAVQDNAEALLKKKLADFKWSFVPYARPGLQLSQAITKAMRPGSNVLVLGNHGLAVGADTVAEAETLLESVVGALRIFARDFATPDLSSLEMRAKGTEYRLPVDDKCHGFAMEHQICRRAAGHVYYPDHVVFLGATIPDQLDSAAVAVALPGQGVLVHQSAKPSVEPMLACLTQVFARLPASAKLRALSNVDIDQLLNWDAEKYRQMLKQ